MLNEIASVATLDIELRDALQRITDILRARLQWEFVACLSVDYENNRVVWAALSSDMTTEFRVGDSKSLDSDPVASAVQAGTPVLLDDTTIGDDRTIQTPDHLASHPGQAVIQSKPGRPPAGIVPGMASELCIPIKHAGRVTALIHLGSKHRSGFSEKLPLLTTVANQVAGTIASAQRYEELHRWATLTEMMSQLSRLAMEATELEELLERIVQYIAGKFPIDIASILLLDEGGCKFILEAYSGSLELRMPDGDEWPISVGVCGRCVRTEQPQLVLDPAADPDYVPGNDAIQSEYIVPIRYRDRVLGVLNLESAAKDTFTPYVQTVFRSLAHQVAGAVNLSSVNQRLQAAIDELERLSAMDGLTGVANRRRFDEVLNVEWRRAYRSDRPISAMLADVDFFKALNDTYGHQYGDDCLRQIAKALSSGLRRVSDFIARYGGEEFAVILPETSAENALAHADRLRHAIEALRIPHRRSTVSSYVTISIGVATVHPRQVEQSDLLIQSADIALYQAKRAGRNRVVGRTLP